MKDFFQFLKNFEFKGILGVIVTMFVASTYGIISLAEFLIGRDTAPDVESIRLLWFFAIVFCVVIVGSFVFVLYQVARSSAVKRQVYLDAATKKASNVG